MRKAPIVMVALAVSIVMSLVVAAQGLIARWPNPTFGLAVTASYYAVGAALVFGFLELGSRLRGAQAVGMKLAAGAVACGRLLEFVRWLLLTASPRLIADDSPIARVVPTLACSLCMIVGLTIAAWPRRNRAIAGCVVAVVSLALWLFAMPLVFAVVDDESGLRVANVVSHLPWIVEALALMWLVAQVEPAEAVPDPRLAARGVRWMSRALWGRVLAVIAFVFVTITARSEHTMQGLYAGELALTLVLFGAFGIGALAVVKARAIGVRRVPLALAGLGMLWCAAMTLARTPMIYDIVTGSSTDRFIDPDIGVFAVAEPLVMLLSIGAVASALRSIAAVRTGAETSTGVAFAAVMVAAIAVQEWGLRGADTHSAVIGVMLLVSILVIIAMGLMAMVLGGIATRLETESPDLPTAKVVY